MKYEFKEGQWFDIRKLTDWQKQWCLDNLEFTGNAERHLNGDTLFPCNLFRFTSEYGFTCAIDVSPVNEITFNDFYWDESDEGSFDNLVYVEPKHVDNNTYYVVEKDKLSEDQWEFLLGNVPLEYEPEDNEIYLNLDPNNRKWFGDTYKSEKQDIYISFNDIFKEVN